MLTTRKLLIVGMMLLTNAVMGEEDKEVVVTRVHSIKATKSRPSKVEAEIEGKIETLLCESLLVQAALVPAMVNRVDGDEPLTLVINSKSNIIRRVMPYKSGRFFQKNYGDYHIDRIATQRTDKGDHIEVFIEERKESKEPKGRAAYNAYDPLIQQLLIASFGYRTEATNTPIDAEFKDQEVVAATYRMYETKPQVKSKIMDR